METIFDMQGCGLINKMSFEEKILSLILREIYDLKETRVII